MVKTTEGIVNIMKTLLITTTATPTITTSTFTKIFMPITKTVAVQSCTATGIVTATAAKPIAATVIPNAAIVICSAITAEPTTTAAIFPTTIPNLDSTISGITFDVLTTTAVATFVTRTTAAAVLTTAIATITTRSTADSMLICCEIPIIDTAAIPTTVAAKRTPAATVPITVVAKPTLQLRYLLP
ncbi:hypothetical protein WUBG_09118 [Wuchereria bancrofti]|uniref:Uncharacterized protein n=1 Tax=Wuchereria bancrofti TaxID=6293 RepID=J9ECR3_WUCBA|nr:hypothetical protein WUBG_09118 [Wuchereria bancrofti]